MQLAYLTINNNFWKSSYKLLALINNTHQWHDGGTSLVSSCKDFSERYSWTKATVTTMTIATVILIASSNCFIHTETSAEARRSNIKGFLNCSKYFFQGGSSSFTENSLYLKTIKVINCKIIYVYYKNVFTFSYYKITKRTQLFVFCV